MQDEELAVYNGLIEYVTLFGLEDAINTDAFETDFELLQKWYDILQPEKLSEKSEPKKLLSDSDYIEYYNLTGFTVKQQIQAIKYLHGAYGFPINTENINQSLRSIWLALAQKVELSQSGIRNLYYKVLAVENKLSN